MQLATFARSRGSIAAHDLAGQTDLVREIQGALITLRLADPPVDGVFGPVTQWALSAFAGEPGTEVEPFVFSSRDAERLLGAAAPGTPVLSGHGGDVAALAAAAMERRGYWIAHHPECVNIVYVEGASSNGTPRTNSPNHFDDLRIVFKVDEHHRPHLAGCWDGTTEPGRYWTEHPMNASGAARIAFSQRKAWVMGVHHAGKPGAHEALVQVAPITVHRDRNRDYRRDGDARDTGLFAVNQHWGYDLPPNDIGKAGAGCLIGRTKAGHREFMAIVKSDPRYRVNNAYRFMTAVLPASALHETSFDPTQPH